MKNCYLLITKNKNNYAHIFNDKLIFNQLNDNHLLRLFMLQKIKKNANISDKIIIYLDNLDIDDFNINKKLKAMLKYQHSIYNIHLVDFDIKLIDLEDINRYNELINKKK